MSIKLRIAVALAVTLSGLGATLWFVNRTVDDIDYEKKVLVDSADQALDSYFLSSLIDRQLVDFLLHSITEGDEYLRSFGGSEEAIEAQLDEMEERIETAAQHLASGVREEGFDEEMDEVEEIEELREAYEHLIGLTEPALKAGGEQTAQEVALAIEGHRHHLTSLLDERLEDEREEMIDGLQAVEKAHRATIFTTAGLALASGGIVLLLLGWTAVSFHRAVGSLKEAAAAYGRRDYGYRSPAVAGEFGPLAEALAAMAGELRRTTIDSSQLGRLFDAAADALLLTDHDSRIQSVNREACRLLGREEEELVGRRLLEFLADGDDRRQEELRRNLIRLADGETVHNWEVEVAQEGGETIPVSLSAGPMLSGDEVTGIVVVGRDLRELSRLYEKQKELAVAAALAAEESAQADAARTQVGSFLAQMSHEIRTPMTGILGMSELLAATELTPRQENFIEAIGRAGRSLLAIINDVLDLSKIEAGQLSLESVDFDVREAVEGAAELVTAVASKKGIELVTDIDPALSTGVQGDPARIRQILANFLSNAVKFTERGEVVTRVTVEDEAERGLALCFEVRDTGVGFPPEATERLFNSFEQIDNSTTRRFGGSGLGLAICKRLVAAMGGEIGADSVPGEGSTFWFRVRLARGAALDSAKLDSLSDVRVMVVDGNRSSRRAIVRRVAGWGLSADDTHDGREALRMLKAAHFSGHAYDLVLSDWRARDENGVALLDAVRREPQCADTPVLLLVDIHADGQVQSEGVPSLLKPVRQSDLYNQIVAILRGDGVERVEARGQLSGTARSADGARVLLAEDNPVNQAVAVEMLEMLGCSVVVVQDGREAVERQAGQPFDLVLMDCEMPVMDGYAAARTMREQGAQREDGRRLPIVALTAKALEGDREICIAAGMDDFVCKPFTMEHLQAVLERWISTDGDHLRDATPPVPGDGAEDDSGVEPVLDGSSLDAIRTLQRPDAEDILQKVVGLYLSSAPDLLEGLRNGVESGDTEQIRAAAHSLKSSSANVGVAKVARACKRLEEQAREAKLDKAGDELEVLEAAFAEGMTALTELVEADRV